MTSWPSAASLLPTAAPTMPVPITPNRILVLRCCLAVDLEHAIDRRDEQRLRMRLEASGSDIGPYAGQVLRDQRLRDRPCPEPRQQRLDQLLRLRCRPVIADAV